MSPVGRESRLTHVPVSTDVRPQLVEGLSAGEFDAWDWPKTELTKFARHLGIPSTGTKAALAARIRKRLPVGQDVAVLDLAAEIMRMPEPTVEVVTSASPAMASRPPSAPPASSTAPGFFRGATDGQTRAQALAAWFAQRRQQSS
jgi:hypothetical protein